MSSSPPIIPPSAIDENANPAWEVLRIAAPTVLTMASYTVMQFVDALMVSHIENVGPLNLAAQGNGGVCAFVPISFYFGLCGVVNTYVSQNLGAGTPRRGPAYAWNSLWIAVAWWVLILLPLAAAIPLLFTKMGHEPELVALESEYARILLVGGILTMASRGIAQFFYGVHRPVVTLVASVSGNIVNFVCNLLLVFGMYGFPKLGITGSAIGTLIGTFVEALIPFSVFLSSKYNTEFGTRSAWRFSTGHMKDIFRIGWPAALMFSNELICWAISMAGLAGAFGKVHNAASRIALQFMQLSFMPAIGISFAMTAIVGRCLGAGRPDLARQRVKLGVMMAMVYMAVCAVLFVIFRESFVSLFIDTSTDPVEREQILSIASTILIIAAVFQIFDGLGITLIGALRGAGDTVWPGVATIVLSWTCIVGLGSLIVWYDKAHGSKWGSIGPWMASGLYLVLLGIAIFYRFARGAWINKHILDEAAGGKTDGEPK